MADVFISYKREERSKVEAIVLALRELGLSVWFDAELRSGESIHVRISREARTAKVVLVLWTRAATQSEWVLGEAEIGRERRVLVAAFLEPTALPPPFNAIHTFDLGGWDGSRSNRAFANLIDELTSLVGATAERTRSSEKRSVPSRSPAREGGSANSGAWDRFFNRSGNWTHEIDWFFRVRGEFVVMALIAPILVDLWTRAGHANFACSGPGRPSCVALALSDASHQWGWPWRLLYDYAWSPANLFLHVVSPSGFVELFPRPAPALGSSRLWIADEVRDGSRRPRTRAREFPPRRGPTTTPYK